MTPRPVVLALVLVAAAAVQAAPAPVAPPAAALLAWSDDPPAVEVRALSAAHTVGLRYGAALDPASFHATLDGERVSPAFHPEPGTTETVALEFIGGRNHLVVEASSKDGLTHATIERWISFARFPGDENAAERVPSAPELKHEVWKRKTPAATPPSETPAETPATKPPR